MARETTERGRAVPPDPVALEALAEAVEAGAGLPEVARAAARALGGSLALIDPSSTVLAVVAASSADERSVLSDQHATAVDLRVADRVVGQLRFRRRSGQPAAATMRMVTALLALEVDRTRAPDRASEAAASFFVQAVIEREVTDRRDLIARGRELGIDLEQGGAVIAARAQPRQPTEGDWRARVLTVAERGARAVARSALAAGHGREVFVIVPGSDATEARRAATGVARELEAALRGFALTVGHSRPVRDPVDLARAAGEALLAVNVAEPGAEGPVAFEETGAYRLLLPAMTDDPEELRRFYAETVEPLVVYDEQYETDLVATLEAYLERDGNVAATAERLFTHRHTVRYRLERARDLSGLDVTSTDGREKLGLGLKAMRVLGIAGPAGPAFEPGASGGTVPKGDKEG